MLMQTRIVAVPDQSELDADNSDPDLDGLSPATCAAFGAAALEVGSPDYSREDLETSAQDTITNVLHTVARNTPLDGEGVEDLVRRALDRWTEET